jgi:hypothetical protein
LVNSSYRGEDHVCKVYKRLCVEAPVDGEADGRQEEQVAQAEEEGGGQEVNLGRGLGGVSAAPAAVAWKWRTEQWCQIIFSDFPRKSSNFPRFFPRNSGALKISLIFQSNFPRHF